MNTYNKEFAIIKKQIIYSVPILFILAIPIHFLYDLTGRLNIVGAFVPVNESVFEHFKLAVFPLILWWIVYYYVLKRKVYLDIRKWTFAAAISSIIAPVFIIFFYYGYKGALGVSFIVMDILSLLFSLIIAQAIAYHSYKYGKGSNSKFFIGLLLLVCIIGGIIYLTFHPVEIPLFRDAVSGRYGI